MLSLRSKLYIQRILICQNFKYSPSEGFLSGIDVRVLGCPFTCSLGTLVNVPCVGTVAPWSTYMNGERILQYYGVGMKKGRCIRFYRINMMFQVKKYQIYPNTFMSHTVTLECFNGLAGLLVLLGSITKLPGSKHLNGQLSCLFLTFSFSHSSTMTAGIKRKCILKKLKLTLKCS